MSSEHSIARLHDKLEQLSLKLDDLTHKASCLDARISSLEQSRRKTSTLGPIDRPEWVDGIKRNVSNLCPSVGEILRYNDVNLRDSKDL